MSKNRDFGMDYFNRKKVNEKFISTKEKQKPEVKTRKTDEKTDRQA